MRDDRRDEARAGDRSVAAEDIQRRSLHGRARVAGLVTGLLLLAGCSSLHPPARQPPPAPRIGYLGSTSLDSPSAARYLEAFRQGLRELDYVEGRTITIEPRFAEGSEERLPSLTRELVDSGVAIVVLADTRAIAPARQVAGTTPLVMAISGDPVAAGTVTSFARPGGNITGLSTRGPQLSGKQLELLTRTVPGVSRIGVLHNPRGRGAAAEWEDVSQASTTLGLELQSLDVHEPADFERAFALATREPPDALLILADPLINTNYTRILDFAGQQRLPTAGGPEEFVDAGGLMTYTPDRLAMFRRAAYYVDKILKGTNPAELPVEQAREFQLVINLKAAQALELDVPRTILVQAHRVIR
jgi:putative ABC transport system substrate-binding protein